MSGDVEQLGDPGAQRPPASSQPIEKALRAVGLPAEMASRLSVEGEPGAPSSRLPVDAVGVACIGAALLAAARLQELRIGERVEASVDRGQVRAALVSERLFDAGDGSPRGGFAPLSRFWPAADGWVRTHANFPWHHRALLEAVGAADDDAPAAAIASRPAEVTEAEVFAAGGVAAAVRAPEEWGAHPQGAAVAAEPLVARVRLGDAESRGERFRRPGRGATAPAAGVRVLDLTRVIAGPVCSRYLGALGADVLRLDPPDLPDLETGQVADTLLGKRSAFIDLGEGAGLRRLHALLDEADVVLLGYRPGSLARFGLTPEELAVRHPGLVAMELAAWGHEGPWSGRRGFDSIVQAASGIAAVEAGPDGEPGALPCQLLDHGTGYLAAAAVLVALAEQWESGGTHLRRLSLARTAHWLLGEGEDGAAAPPDAEVIVGRPRWDESGAAFVAPVERDPSVTAVPPPGALGGTPLRWRGPIGRYGSAAPEW